MIRGYENNPEANATSFVDGWFRTGDQGYLDEDGYLTLVGRIKELINRGGEKISPREIDEVAAERIRRSRKRSALGFRIRHGARKFPPPSSLRSPTERSRAVGVLPRAAGRLQASEADSHYRSDSADRDRQDSTQRSSPQAYSRSIVKIAIAGAGAIGGYIGARLAQAGGDVMLFARGPHLEAMRERGLRVVEPERAISKSGRQSPAISTTIGPADVVVPRSESSQPDGSGAETAVAVRTKHDRRQHAKRRSVVVFSGLGGELEGLRLERVDPGGVIASSIEAAAGHRLAGVLRHRIVEPGVIHHTEGNRISIGEPDGSRSERCQKIADAFLAAGFRCPVTDEDSA